MQRRKGIDRGPGPAMSDQTENPRVIRKNAQVVQPLSDIVVYASDYALPRGKSIPHDP